MVIRVRRASGCVLLVAAFHACGGSSTTPLSNGSGSGGGSSGAGSGDDGGGTASGSSTGGGVGSSGSSSGSSGGSGGQPGSDGGRTGDAAGSSGGDSGSGLVTYPPLKFAAIGQAVQINGQFYFTEGPVWDPTKNVLYFTDINAQQNGTTGGAIYRLTLPSTIDVLLQPDGNADGIGLDPQGNIIAAGFVSRNVWRLSGTNGMQTLAPCSQGGGTCYMGQKVNTPDDITARSDGVIYFTDPTFGSGSQGFPAQSLPLGFQGVYRLTKDGTVHREDQSTSGPNGVNLSPDEKTLYVAYTLSNQVAKFAVASDGSLSNKTTFASANLADSMCVDAGGNVYVGTSSGLAVFNPAGQSLGTISVGGQITTNCAFGGPDQKTLFITSRAQSTLLGTPTLGSSSLYKVDNMPVPGMPWRN